MLSGFELQTALQNFRHAASEYGFDFMENPQLEEGLSAFGFIPNYVGPNGTIICLLKSPDSPIDTRILNWCKTNGYFCSFLNAALLTGAYDRACFRAMLRDWGRHDA